MASIEPELNETWLHGTYEYGQINTNYCYVSVKAEYTSEGIDFFAQDQNALDIIMEIHQIWLKSNLDEEEAFLKWINMYL